jgi:S1-C subfamily serine protease
MKWVQAAAGVLASLCTVSYGSAAPLEAQLGKPVQHGGGSTASGGRAPQFHAPAQSSAGRFGQVLGALEKPDAEATRGAADSQVYQRAARSVVLVVTDRALGSGALISADGQIVTNLHVVQGAKVVSVAFKPAIDGAAVTKADLRRVEVIKVDEVADLALLKVDEVPAGIQPLQLGDSNSLQVGADVHAIGHPTGETWTYTRGVVSQIRRAYDWKAEDKLPHEATVIQTQTPINPGNSGGPLLDSQGKLVGINSFTSGGEGLNFAVSVEDVKSMLARGHDRNVTAQAAKTCEWKELGVEDAKNPPGQVHAIDRDCDGEADATLFIAKDRRKPDMLLADDDGDGKYDTIYYDFNHDGEPEYALYDTDGDGKYDVKGEFRKGENEPYRWERITE